jgi:putative restriction endonuclease
MYVDVMARVFGELPDHPSGTWFADRKDVARAGVHRPIQGGISGSESEGADSIVVSGGYEDDEDYGDTIVYTGQGGNDPATKKQVADQTRTRHNQALARSSEMGLPVRVVRGAGGNQAFSPRSGYRYDGLFYVEEYWGETGRSGYKVWRYRLVQDTAGKADAKRSGSPPSQAGAPRFSTVQRLVRNTAVTQWVKEHHDYVCQVCGLRLLTAGGAYAEGAHIRPVGRPHQGPDALDNVLCLCPNDHVRLDRGVIMIAEDLTLVEHESTNEPRKLRVSPQHVPSHAYLAYHRQLWT